VAFVLVLEKASRREIVPEVLLELPSIDMRYGYFDSQVESLVPLKFHNLTQLVPTFSCKIPEGFVEQME